MCSTPGGSPASSAISANFATVNGAKSGDLTTTQFPAASAGAIFIPTDMIGPFQVRMIPTMPYGSGTV